MSYEAYNLSLSDVLRENRKLKERMAQKDAENMKLKDLVVKLQHTPPTDTGATVATRLTFNFSAAEFERRSRKPE